MSREYVVYLPSFTDCEKAVESGTATPLEKFIIAFEPVGYVEELKFREGLSKALSEAFRDGQKNPI